MLSVHDPNAEEILDAEVIKPASRPANLRPNAEEILDAEVIKTRVQACKSASSGAERKDQIRILQTKTWISKYLDSGARFIKIGT